MKKCVVLLLAAMLLCGCAAEQTYETVADDWVVPAMAQPRDISVKLPGEAEMSAVDSEAGRFYLCDDYEISIETLDSGDLNATLQAVCGYSEKDLTIIKTQPEGLKRYDFVWASAGERGDLLGRGVILDDGNYHYVMTALRDAESKQSIQVVWSEVFASFNLV